MTAVFWVLGALLILYLLAGYLIFLFMCRRESFLRRAMHRLTHSVDGMLAPYRAQIDAGMAFLRDTPHEEAALTSFDGLRLRAAYYPHPAPRAVMIACHGYRSSGPRDFACACEFYYNLGISILLIDQRAAGQSEGKYITFGAREREDVLRWCEWVKRREPGTPILLAGLSLGASTVLMTADDAPPEVRAFLADCGYTSPRDVLVAVARENHITPAVVLLPAVNLWTHLLAGFGLRRRSTVKALGKNTRPVFLVHGEEDDFVPHAHSVRNRDACAGPVTFLSVPGASHGMSYLIDTARYQRALETFVKDIL